MFIWFLMPDLLLMHQRGCRSIATLSLLSRTSLSVVHEENSEILSLFCPHAQQIPSSLFYSLVPFLRL
jgi:hypothetical protein